MKRPKKYLVGTLASLLLITAGTTFWAWRALQDVSPFYQQALKVEPPQLQAESEELKNRVARLIDETKKPKPWQTEFTDSQINGWLAIALMAQYAERVPESLTDPRVAFEDDHITLGLRYREGKISTVITLVATPRIVDADMLGIRLDSAHAGSLPISTSKIARKIAAGAEKMEIPLAWTEEEGSPVALFPLAAAISSVGQRRQLETLQIEDGKLRFAGRTSLEDTTKRLASRETETRSR
ncbi:MAG: hypothetical protein RH917_10715 [Lacipirellulaceae bacterium]